MSSKRHGPELKILIGISGSGKTTWAINWIASHPNYVRVNRDDLRSGLTGIDKTNLKEYYKNPNLFKLEQAITKIQDHQVELLLSKRLNVILDNTNLDGEEVERVIAKFNHLADIELRVFETSLSKAMDRVLARDNRKDTEYIKKQYKDYQKFVGTITSYNYRQTHPRSILVEQDGSLPHCKICDLDGTLALFYGKNPFDRDFENDIVNEPVAKIMNATDGEAIFFSGRKVEFEDQTRIFLKRAGMKEYKLFMRGDKDDRRDSLVKIDMYNEHIRDKYYVDFVVDDRLQVIEEVWNEIGLFVFNVNQGNRMF